MTTTYGTGEHRVRDLQYNCWDETLDCIYTGNQFSCGNTVIWITQSFFPLFSIGASLVCDASYDKVMRYVAYGFGTAGLLFSGCTTLYYCYSTRRGENEKYSDTWAHNARQIKCSNEISTCCSLINTALSVTGLILPSILCQK